MKLPTIDRASMSANVFNDFVNWKNLEELEHQQLVLDALTALREG